MFRFRTIRPETRDALPGRPAGHAVHKRPVLLTSAYLGSGAARLFRTGGLRRHRTLAEEVQLT